MLNKKLSALFVGILLASSSAHAAAGSGYVGFSIGGWNGIFKQSAGSFSTELDSGLSLGFGLALGLDLGSVRIEYTPHTYFAYIGTKTSTTGRANDFYTWSLLAGNLALDLPVLPLSPYIGGGLSDANFSFGSNASLDGAFWRVGCDLTITQTPKMNAALRVEYQQHYLPDSSAGTMPDTTQTRMRVLFAGLVIRGGGDNETKK